MNKDIRSMVAHAINICEMIDDSFDGSPWNPTIVGETWDEVNDKFNSNLIIMDAVRIFLYD